MYKKLEEVLPEEEKILQFWEENNIFAETIRKTKGKKAYVFYEGPPTANGKPHFGHLLARVYKDLFPRYKTMRGFYVERKGGWDTHGLPVELEVEKELGLNSKIEIERYGIERFINKCKESVWHYKREWEQMIKRMGFWIDLENPYITYTDEYIESVWWALKQIWKKGLLYQGHKVLPYCPRCGTPLSSHEVAQGYSQTVDPSIYVKLPIKSREKEYLLMWTTTPWTVPSNVALAVGVDFTYAKVQLRDEKLILAEKLVPQVILEEHEIIETIEGKDLVGLRYEPPYRMTDDEKAYRVVDADFVNLVEGTGIVHIAPAYGEEDYILSQEKGLPLIHLVNLEGKFKKDFKLAPGEFVKEADPKIIEDLSSRGYLYRHETYQHEYPFCWRCDTPLLYYAIDSWFIKTTAVKNKIIKNNLNIKWYPHHMQRGRFGDFLQNMKDWALSRNRFWGTPLNIWTCEEGHEQAVGSRKELIELAKDKELAAKVELHRPYIDEIILKCKCGKEMQRVPHVIDAWFDSGMMHTAQWHYPSENEEKFKANFPADFICEGQDQTRGWFYTLLVTSTLLYNKESFKCVLVTGYGLDAEGKAMSKSRGNVIDPWDVIDRWGADAIRWYLYSSGAPWKTRRLAVESVGEVLHGMLGTLRNVYNFFALYAKIDGFNPAEYKMNKPTILDRWITSRLNSTIDEVTAFLDDYNVVDATGSIERFVDDLSKWYVRCSRRRFWGSGMDQDKVAAYLTLYHVLVELSKLLAPFAPFLADLIYQNLKTNGLLSVHLCDWPKGGEIDRTLEEKMATVRAIAALGRAARQEAKIKVRQPLAKIVVKKTPQTAHLKEPELKKLLLEELNIKELEIADDLKTKEKAVKLEEEGGENAVAILTEITSDLMEEGFVRELCHRIQWLRKRAGYKVTDRIKLYYEADLDVERMMRKYEEHIKEEVLAKEIYKGIPEEVDFSSKEEINGLKATLGLIR